MKNYLYSIFFTFVIALLISSCSSETQSGLRAVPTAFGNLNEIVVVMDNDMWERPIGDTLRYYYSAAYPLLPQPESIFDLRHFTTTDLNKDPLRKELRTYMVVANLEDESSLTTQMVLRDIGEEKARSAKETPNDNNSAVGYDKWAKGQLMMYQFAYSEDELIEVLKANFPAVKKRVNKFDNRKLQAYVYLDGENKRLMEEVKLDFGVQMRIPNDYFMAINDGEIIWMRKETEEISSNLLLKKIPYESQDQLTKDYLIAVRDSIGRKYISSTIEDTYMRINNIDLPVISNATKVNGYYAIEARGVWEIVNDYMGGAFVSYLIHNPNTNELLFIDGFLHAPGKEKRDFMEHLNYVIKTIKF